MSSPYRPIVPIGEPRLWLTLRQLFCTDIPHPQLRTPSYTSVLLWEFLITSVFSLQVDSTYRWAQTLTDSKTTVLYWHPPPQLRTPSHASVLLWEFLITYVFSLQADSTYRRAQTLTDTKTTVLYWHAPPTEDTFLRLCIIMRVSNHFRLLLTGR